MIPKNLVINRGFPDCTMRLAQRALYEHAHSEFELDWKETPKEKEE